MDLDDVVIAEQVMATHDLNDNIELDADFVINLTENIFNSNTVSREVEQDMLITEMSIQDFREVEKDMPMPQAPIQKELSYQIKQLSFEAKRTEKSYEALLHAFSHSHNNLEVLKLIFNVNDDFDEIFEHRKPGTLYAAPFPFIGLENKRVILIIVSDTNLSEAGFLYHHLSKFDISPWTILIPIIDYPEVWTEARTPSVSIMSYGLKLLDPCKRITPQFIRFVKERCVPSFQSGGEPIVISLDIHGRLVHTNALHIILTWRGALAFDTLTIGSGNNIISLLQKELTEMTLGVDSVIDDIEKRKCDLVNRIRNTIDDWRNGINMRIQDSDSSYNYTSKNEEMLWHKETWNLKLLGNDKVRQSWPFSKNYNIDSWIGNWVSPFSSAQLAIIETIIANMKGISNPTKKKKKGISKHTIDFN
nr:protein SIEVE ELEMENT OCCLUSION B-like [Ipomoea batatas]